MKFIFTGDLVIDRCYESNNIGPKLKSVFAGSDFNIVNLEAPLSRKKVKINKTGPHISSNEKSIDTVFNDLKIDLACLANNHFYDYGEEGVDETISFCDNRNRKYVGGGKNLESAKRIFYLDTIEGRVAIINIAENEWASATNHSGGANPLSLIDNFQSIKEAKRNADFVFLVFHGGNEYYNLPSPEFKKRCHFFVDLGVDLVVCHHPHVLSGFEEYKGVPIYYSLGNFLFTESDSSKEWYEGIVLEVTVTDNKLAHKPYFVEVEKDNFAIELAGEQKKIVIQERFDSLSDIISNDTALVNHWNNYVRKKQELYMRFFSPKTFIQNRYVVAVLNKLNVSLINKKGILLMLNLIRCESHSDLSKAVLQEYLKNR